VGEDLPLEGAKLRAGLETGALDELAPVRVERCEGVRLAPGAVEGDHQELRRAFSFRVARHQVLQLGQDGDRLAQLE